MSEIHIYRATGQPATKFCDDVVGKPIWITNKPNKRIACQTCLRKRFAKNLIVRVYYDHTHFICAPTKGCNSPKAKSWFCTKHQVNHRPKTRYWSCRERKQ